MHITNNKTVAEKMTAREVPTTTRIQEETREEVEANLTTEMAILEIDNRITREMEDKIILEEEEITNDEYNNLHVQF